MTNFDASPSRSLLQAIPKVELHRHLEGSLRLSTLLEIAREYRMDVPTDSIEALRPHLQMTPGDPFTSEQFLSFFPLLRQFYRSPEIIHRLTYEVVADAALDNVKYLELRFTPAALAHQCGFTFEQVADWVCDASNQAQDEHDITVRLIFSMNRHEDVSLGEGIVQLAVDRLSRGAVGVDLAGIEKDYPARPFGSLFLEAKRAGLGITIHAGEWFGPSNVLDAIENLEADRLGHGVRVAEDSRVARIARERDIAFEICITSNLQSGVIAKVEQHPLRDLYHLKLKTTINTDDPSVSGITLTDEMDVAIGKLGLSLEDIVQHIMHGVDVAFLPEGERAKLRAEFQARLDATLKSVL